MANNFTNIYKTKESNNSDGQQLYQLVKLLAITVKTFFCFVDIGRIVGHHL
jgi:hypothetical protein